MSLASAPCSSPFPDLCLRPRRFRMGMHTVLWRPRAGTRGAAYVWQLVMVVGLVAGGRLGSQRFDKRGVGLDRFLS